MPKGFVTSGLILIIFAGLLETRESSIPVAAQLGGDVTLDINGAQNSQCKTHEGLVVMCFNRTTMGGIGPGFQNRISGSCDHIKLKDVQKGDLCHRFICENLDRLKPASYTYSINATTAPPQNVSLSVTGSKVSVFWEPPPAYWQTGPILEYEVKCSCNGSELLMNKTVNGTSTVLEGLPTGVWCTVSVAAVTSDAVGTWSEPKPVYLPPPGSSENNAQPVEERKRIFPVVFVVVFLVVLLIFLNGRRVVPGKEEEGVALSVPRPNAEQTENGYATVPITQNDKEETQVH